MKILVVGPSWIGDMVMAQSLLMALKQRYSGCSISVLAPAWTQPLLVRIPEIDQVIEMPVGHGKLELSLRRSIARRLKLERFDQAVVLPGSFKSALIPWLSKIPKRTGFKGECRWGLLNDIRKLDKSKMPLNVQRYVSLADNPDGPFPQAEALKALYPKLTVEVHSVRHSLENLQLSDKRNILALCPGAEYGPAKQWPASYFAAVAKQKIESGWQVWIFGSEKDAQTGQAIKEELDDKNAFYCFNLAGKTSLGEAIDLLSLSQAVVTNDSGLMHVAAALGLPVLAIYGSTSADFTPPLTDRAQLFNLQLDCSPCFKRECPLGHLDCLKKLYPSQIITALENR